jgi:hypothetical protein
LNPAEPDSGCLGRNRVNFSGVIYLVCILTIEYYFPIKAYAKQLTC